MSANMHLAAADLRRLADSLEALEKMRRGGIEPGDSHREPSVSHGDTTFRLGWVDEDGFPGHYVIVEAEG